MRLSPPWSTCCLLLCISRTLSLRRSFSEDEMRTTMASASFKNFLVKAETMVQVAHKQVTFGHTGCHKILVWSPDLLEWVYYAENRPHYITHRTISYYQKKTYRENRLKHSFMQNANYSFTRDCYFNTSLLWLGWYYGRHSGGDRGLVSARLRRGETRDPATGGPLTLWPRLLQGEES